jgi:hypothetical protein
MHRLRTAGLIVLLLGSCARRSANAPDDFEAGRPGEQAYEDVSGQPVLPLAASASPDRQPGQSTKLGAIADEAAAREQIVAGALAGKEAHARELSRKLADRLATNARQAAKGMVPSGTPLSAELGAGEHAVGRWTLNPRHCYAIVAAASDEVSSMQINLIAAPPRPPQLLAQSDPDAQPSLGSTTCLSSRSSSQLHILVDIHVIRGHGTVALQLYRR